jgi:elongation factor G
MLDREHEARDDLLERLSEYDDHLLEELIEDKTPADRGGARHLRPAAGENRVFPALIGSAGTATASSG